MIDVPFNIHDISPVLEHDQIFVWAHATTNER